MKYGKIRRVHRSAPDTDSDSQDSDVPPTDLDSDSQVSAPLEVNKDDGELATIH